MTDSDLLSSRTDAAQGNLVRASPKPSLVISPDLDALLAHDERIRRETKPLDTSPSPSSGKEIFYGLSPPPRGPRRPSLNRSHRERSKSSSSSPLSVGDTPGPAEPDPEVDMPIGLMHSSNPFINPAPTMEIILTADSIVPPQRSSSIPTTWIPGEDADKYANGVIEEQLQSGVNSNTVPSNTEPRRSRTPDQPAGSPHERTNSNSISLPRIQVKAKHFLTRFSDLPNGSPNKISADHHVSLAELPPDGLPKSRKRGKLVKPAKDPQLEIGNRQKSGVGSGSRQQLLPLTLQHARSSTSSLSSHSDSFNGSPSIVADEPLLITTSPNLAYSNHSPIIVTSDLSDDKQSRQFAGPYTLYNVSDVDSHLTSRIQPIKSSKPLLPKGPKPRFNLSSPDQTPPCKKPPHNLGIMGSKSPKSDHTVPPTTNLLNRNERAELVRKNRKLVKMFGKMPGAESYANQDPQGKVLSISRPGHQRGAMSMDVGAAPVWPPTSMGTLYITPNGRRHSSPFSPHDFPFLSDPDTRSSIDVGSAEESTSQRRRSITSFTDFSDDEASSRKNVAIQSAQSFFENMTEEEQAEEERRRKRDKLAKLHRFLGSRVPMDLVLGVTHTQSAALPPLENVPTAQAEERDERRPWMRRRRSSSAVAWPSSWSDDIDRLKEDLDIREKAVNVRRAVKMEKVFGVLPPQKLYHTRNSPSPSAQRSSGSSFLCLSSGRSSSPEFKPSQRSEPSSFRKKHARRDTSESVKLLLPHGLSGDYDFATSPPPSITDVYSHYQHSLNSLHEIIDRDDKQSLVELHRYLHSEFLPETPQPDPVISPSKSERRRSLPSSISMVSLSSMFTATSPKHETTDFQLRRRRAAKLTQFFGVDYRDLIKDVLESIEKGVDEEQKRGTLKPGEAEDLLQKVYDLRRKPGTSY